MCHLVSSHFSMYDSRQRKPSWACCLKFFLSCHAFFFQCIARRFRWSYWTTLLTYVISSVRQLATAILGLMTSLSPFIELFSIWYPCIWTSNIPTVISICHSRPLLLILLRMHHGLFTLLPCLRPLTNISPQLFFMMFQSNIGVMKRKLTV